MQTITPESRFIVVRQNGECVAKYEHPVGVDRTVVDGAVEYFESRDEFEAVALDRLADGFP